MDFNVNYSVDLIKSNETGDGKLNIKIVASSPIPDRENDIILTKAFTKDLINDYLANSPVIDYNHGTVRGKDEIEKVKCHIGIAKSVDILNSKPIISGFLFEDNEIVKSAIAPTLKYPEGAKLWKASLGGSILKAEKVFNTEFRKTVRQLTIKRLNHCAICPADAAINPDTSIQIVKSFDNQQIIELVDEGIEKGKILDFDSIETFNKALMSGYSTDMAQVQGGQTFTSQSLEGNLVNQTFGDKYQQLFFECLDWIENNPLPVTYALLVEWFMGKGIDIELALNLSTFIVDNADNIKRKILIGGN